MTRFRHTFDTVLLFNGEFIIKITNNFTLINKYVTFVNNYILTQCLILLT